MDALIRRAHNLELCLKFMAVWSPTIEGFHSVSRKPVVPVAEVAWRWSFGAAAWVLLGLGVLEYLDTLPVSSTDLLMLRTGHPLLVSNALSHIVRGTGFRLVLASVFLFSALAILWILLASIGRAATLDALIGDIRKRARVSLDETRDIASDVPSMAGEAEDAPPPWRLRSLAGLHFFRAALALAACAGGLGAVILAGFASSKTDPHPGIVFFLALTLLLLVWMAWSWVSWLLSLASIFVVRQGQDTFGALSSSVGLCRDRMGAVTAVGAWFGLAHLVLFVVATSVVTFPMAFAQVLPGTYLLTAVVLLTLAYFAIVDTLYIGRAAGYVAILEVPPTPPGLPVPQAEVPPDRSQLSAISLQPAPAMVDQEEPILSDTAALLQANTQDSAFLAQPSTATMDQEERILGDLSSESEASNPQ